MEAKHREDALRLALSGILDWYEALPDPGLVPNSVELSARLREANRALSIGEATRPFDTYGECSEAARAWIDDTRAPVLEPMRFADDGKCPCCDMPRPEER